MGTPSSDNLLLGQGQLFFDRFDMSSGIPTPLNQFRHLGNCPSFSLTVNTEKVEMMTSMYAVKRKYKSVVRQSKATGKISLTEYDPDNLAMVMLGENKQLVRPAVVDHTGANAYVFPYAVVEQDTYLKLPDRWITAASVSVMDNAGGSTFLIDTDYTIDAERGRIYIVPGGSIVPGIKLKVAYSAAIIDASAGFRAVIGATKPRVEGRLIFVGDPTTGPTYYADFWHVMVSPEGELGMIGTDFQNFGVNFFCFDKRTQHPGEPFYRILHVK